jgi:hypothetical protein
MEACNTYSLKQKIVHNLQHNSLLHIQQLTTNNTVRQCTCISEEDPDLSIMGAVLVQTPFFIRNIKRYQHVIQSENYKTW